MDCARYRAVDVSRLMLRRLTDSLLSLSGVLVIMVKVKSGQLASVYAAPVSPDSSAVNDQGLTTSL